MIFSGASVVLGVSVPKLKSRSEAVPALLTVRLAQVHCLVLSVMETPRTALFPAVAASVTALLAQEPPVTPMSFPELMAVVPE